MVNKRLEELLEFVESTDLQELVWEKKGALISFRRSAVSEPHRQNAAAPPLLRNPILPEEISMHH